MWGAPAEPNTLGMDQKVMYAFRGWIAFVAFMDLGVAIRSFIEKKCFLGEFANQNNDRLVEQDDPTLPRILGMYFILKAIALIHCTVFIHYTPFIADAKEEHLELRGFCGASRMAYAAVIYLRNKENGDSKLIFAKARIAPKRIISMGMSAIALTIVMYLVESLYFHSATVNFYIIFPCVLNGLTLAGLGVIPYYYLKTEIEVEDENVELLKQATSLRKKKSNKKMR